MYFNDVNIVYYILISLLRAFYWRICELVKLCKLIHIIPHLFVVGVKNMRAVAMHLNALDILSENIARNVAALVNYKALFARLGGFVGKHSAVQPGANDQIIIHGLFMHSFCARPKPKQVFILLQGYCSIQKSKMPLRAQKIRALDRRPGLESFDAMAF